MGGDERDHHRRVETPLHGVPGRGQEEEERGSVRSFIPDGKMKQVKPLRCQNRPFLCVFKLFTARQSFEVLIVLERL